MNKNHTSLSDIKVLVTRPVHQAQTLCDMIAELGGQAIRLPAIEIDAITVTPEAQEQINHPELLDYAVFISPNAVEYGLAQLLAQGEIPDKLKLVTIGKASADKVQEIIGRAPDIFPTENYNSESLLALESMQAQAVNHKQVLIFRGRGGRELLASSLKQRGAIVNYAEVYQRIRPEPDPVVLEHILSFDLPDVVTVTSDEGLDNLVAMFSEHFDEQQLEPLWHTSLVVVTDKMRVNARHLGFKKAVMVAQKASNEALLDCILDCVKNNIIKDKELSNGKK